MPNLPQRNVPGSAPRPEAVIDASRARRTLGEISVGGRISTNEVQAAASDGRAPTPPMTPPRSMPYRFRAGAIGGVLLALGACSSNFVPSGAPPPDLTAPMLGAAWGTDAISEHSIPAFVSPTGRLRLSEEVIETAKALYGWGAAQRARDWEKLLNQIADEPRRVQMTRIHSWVTRRISQDDEGKKQDDWKAPLRTLASGTGDCEDFALLSYVSLRILGVPARDLEIAVGEYRPPERHAVLLVRDTDGKRWTLNNLEERVTKYGSRTFRGPHIYSLNELRPGPPQRRQAFLAMRPFLPNAQIGLGGVIVPPAPTG